MQPAVEIKPKNYPINLINKDWTDRKCYCRDYLVEFIHKVHDVEVYEDDVWLVTLPKCGTTWMQELLWLVMNDFDFETAKEIDLELRTPFMEFDFSLNQNFETGFRPIESLKRPRLIRSHLCLPLLPQQIWDKKPKLIYVARNIKDAFVSEYHQHSYFGNLANKSLDDYVNDQMIEGKRAHEPFQNMTEFYGLRNEPWLFYTSFERMKSNLRQVILDVCTFLNKSITEDNMVKMLKHLSFEEMKKNPKTNHIWGFKQIYEQRGLQFKQPEFFRKGKVNGYKEELSPHIIEKLDKWVNENFSKYNVTMEELLLLKNEDDDHTQIIS